MLLPQHQQATDIGTEVQGQQQQEQCADLYSHRPPSPSIQPLSIGDVLRRPT